MTVSPAARDDGESVGACGECRHLHQKSELLVSSNP